MSQTRPALPSRNEPAVERTGKKPALDGEVIPPVMRVVPPRPEPDAAPPPASPSFRLGTALLVAGFALGLAGTSGFAAYRWVAHERQAAAAPSPMAIAMAHLAKDVGDLRAAVEANRPDPAAQTLKKSVDALKAELETLRSSDAAAVGQLSAKLDKAAATGGPSTADILARLDKLDHDGRFADIAARLDRIEHQVSSPMPTGSVAAPARPAAALSAVPQTVAAESRPPRPAVLDNWILRDVYSGVALVEGRSGSIREVAPGESLPGAGEVRSIERQGRNWIVVTSRGIINNQTW